MKNITIGKETFPFDAADLAARKKYCDALDQYIEAAKPIDAKYEASDKKQRDLLEQFEGICREAYAFIDKMFGEGAAIRALGENYNIDACIGAFETLNVAINEHDNNLIEKLPKKVK
ncbi:hypothetical protein OBO34_21775 [Clostridiales Family XIII bacterium ASD5510]|uniref:DUF6673 domain-containing protein n=1 Tax=Hominibacterium faecale TaxID=2839743 RepID=A0A9J6QZR5_9FIRM|nr:DUF6673 family protein [Hominibacterium faecale]MCU7380948.1 hypothetical protein [Hominibacterium faecale]